MGLFGRKQVDPIALAEQQRLAEQQQAEAVYRQGILSLRDILAPPSLEITGDHIRIGTRFARTIYVYGYPRQIYTGWLSPLINLDEVLDISMFVYPIESQVVLNNLKRKVGQLEASYAINQEKGRVRDPGLEAAIMDAEELRDKLQVGEERFFRFGLYVTLYADSLEDLKQIHQKVEGMMGQALIYTKAASMQMEPGFNSTLPLAYDQLQVARNMDTGALSTSFPFTSAELTRNEGVLYGINRHNNGLVLFDRFSLENANMVVFAKSGAGKSFAVKLEALRSLMLGTEIIIIDPEDEYRTLCEAVGGSYLRLSLSSQNRLNPFDLPHVLDSEDADNALRANIITLHGLLRLMMGGDKAPLSPAEDADLDVALINTYAKAGITNDPLTHGATPPTMNDLYKTLSEMSGSGPSLAARLRQYTTGTFAGIFSEQSNVNLYNKFVVFNIRDLEEELRPVGMYIVLNYIWNKVKSEKKRRILVVDEAWQLMKYEDSANFMFSIAKRARKYGLGLTTISQDVDDFLSSRMGRAVVSNSSLQLLLKQAPSSVDLIGETFKLTAEEKARLTTFPVGEGLFFAGLNHVIIRILASQTEGNLISTSPPVPDSGYEPPVTATESASEPAPAAPVAPEPTPPAAPATPEPAAEAGV